ncbi:hypothetical protein DCAR_0831358 [Daucus carota subsp. sativus]|uniref:RNase H type-1 domain-containing protein n=1 Tax=Daucus carota subsp. sativus TaxID=79200 RepID=A0AAF0XRD3_DAUCS|nr:hypothetical protein DCAR_0831358 [Daucus carota subsp. sativus]
MKRVDISTVCSWFLRGVEDDIHVLFQCCFAREVWEGSGLSNLVSTRQNDTAMTVLQRIFQAGSKEQIRMASLLCWNLWQRRNSWVWNHVNTSAFGVRSKAMSMLVEWQQAREEGKERATRQPTVARSWCKPPAGWVKINTDAACVLGTGQVGIGCIIRDEWGNFLRARSSVVQGSYHPREAEAISLKEALTWTKDWKRSKCVFECDAKILVDAVNGNQGNTYFHAIVDDCTDLLKHFDEVLVLFAHRSTNMVAHSLARVSYSMSGPTEWLHTAPDFIICMLDSDKL